MAIVIPTYNEAKNIEELLERLTRSYASVRIYVVDDDSPDGTGAVVEAFARRHLNVHLITRPGKGGRGSAVATGFVEALKCAELIYVLEMDADSSHAPDEISRLLDRIADADVVIGSRYLPQSRIIGWPTTRHVFSRLANSFARVLLGVPISDYTNGFRLYRRAALEKVGLDELRESGYIVLSEMAYKLHMRGCTFAEIPTVFVNRNKGRSNTTLSEISRAFTGVIRIRFGGRHVNRRDGRPSG